MAKKILMLASSWDNGYICNVVRGIIRRLLPSDAELFVLNAYDETNDMSFYERETEIFDLLDDSEYDGLIASMTSVDAVPCFNRLLPKLKEKNVPMITLDQEFEGVPFFGIDNYGSMYEIVEHMITVHGCKTFCYVGGPKDNAENVERFRAFCDCLHAHGIEPDMNAVRHYRFLPDDGRQAFRDFYSNDTYKNDCVICANDYMAKGYCEEAMQADWYAPENFLISGFDNLPEGQMFIPSLTSVNRNWEELGYEAADAILRMIDHEEIPMTNYTACDIRYNESCGCVVNRDVKEEYRDLQKNEKSKKIEDFRIDKCRRILCASTDLNSLCTAMDESSRLLGVPDMAVCINQNFFDGDYLSEKTGFSAELNVYETQGMSALNRCESFVPPQWDGYGYRFFMLSPCHFGKQTYGYFIMPYTDDFYSKGHHKRLTEAVTLALVNISQRISLDAMNSQLRDLYITDQMTGLLNRFGYTAKANGFYEMNMGRVYMVYMDLDNLKVLNDRYGHSMGDIAIRAAAESVRQAFDDTDIIVRMGGDEFLVIGEFTSPEELERREAVMAENLRKIGEAHNVPIPLLISVGHVWNEGIDGYMTLDALMQKADANMYEIKQKRKASSMK